MAVPWPVALQQLLNRDSFTFQLGKTTIESDMDVGLPKVRRRYNRPINTVNCTIDIDYDLYDDLYYFFNTTLNGGVTIFEFDHPLTGVLTNFRFLNPPSISPLGGRIFRVSMQWEEQP